jgi:hypothetical protein
MRTISVVSSIALLALAGSACDLEGEDVALFNNVNELVVVGKTTAELNFDRTRVPMFVHLHRSPDFRDVPAARLSLSWYRIDEQGNKVALSETRRVFFDAVTEGDYYARAFIDLDRDSEPTRGEPLDVWRDDLSEPKVVRVREESRWKLEFVFEERVGRLPTL